jgi:hypothetical protein
VPAAGRLDPHWQSGSLISAIRVNENKTVDEMRPVDRNIDGNNEMTLTKYALIHSPGLKPSLGLVSKIQNTVQVHVHMFANPSVWHFSHGSQLAA